MSLPFYEPSRALTYDEMEEIKQCFVRSAIRCQKAGFDSLILHSCHQYLLFNFITLVWNKRTDKYGGSLENRMRYPVEVLRAVKEAVNIPVMVRINTWEIGGVEILGAEKEYTLDDAIEVAKIYEANGVDGIQTSTWAYGPYVHSGLFSLEWGARLPQIAAIKKEVKVPVIGHGHFNPELAESAIKDGKLDFVGFGRGQIVEPYFGQKVAAGKASEITPCICCYKCEPVSHFGLETIGMHCSVNARTGYEAEFPYPLAKSENSKKVVVVGGGPGGMEAARVAVMRGHKVTLYEREKEMGGRLLVADKAPEKQNMGLLAPYLKEEIKKAGVRIEVGKEATIDLILKQQPDAVIIAAGAQPIIPKIKGLEKAEVVTALDVLTGKASTGEKVIVIGASMVGLEVSEVLAGQGKKLTICEVLPEIGASLNIHTRDISVKRLKEHDAQFYVGVKSEEITDGGMAIVDKDGKKHLVEFNTIVMAAGSKPNKKLFTDLKGKVPELYLVGDAKETRYVIDAVSEGFRAAYSL